MTRITFDAACFTPTGDYATYAQLLVCREGGPTDILTILPLGEDAPFSSSRKEEIALSLACSHADRANRELAKIPPAKQPRTNAAVVRWLKTWGMNTRVEAA